jgi:hypothetical protein
MRQIRLTRARITLRDIAPGFAVAPDSFCVARLWIVVRRAWVNRVDRLRHFPTNIRAHHRPLIKFFAVPDESRSPWGRRLRQINVTSVPGRNQCRSFLNSAVAIDTFNCRRRARFAIEIAVSVNVDVEVTVNALHSVREVGVFQMNGFRKLLSVILWDCFIV